MGVGFLLHLSMTRGATICKPLAQFSRGIRGFTFRLSSGEREDTVAVSTKERRPSDQGGSPDTQKEDPFVFDEDPLL